MNIITTRSILCIAALSTSALATSPVPTSATPPATSTTLGSAAAPKVPTVNVEKQKLQPAAGEKFDPSEIRQALSELLALKEGVGGIEQIQEKKAALKAAIESGIKKDRKSVLRLLFNIEPKAAFAWANQQTDTKLKDLILGGIIASVEGKNPNGAVAYIQLLWPGASEERTIPEAFRMAAYDDFQGALAVGQRKGTGPFIDAHHATQSKSDKHPRNCQRALRLTCATRTSSVPCEPRRFRWSIFERQAQEILSLKVVPL
ncbi:MAG: hypothetical protein DWH94_09355 [Planctomycetota bacterium]|nr:MAG: hypothetical protein DWH94_09355 [Planctomycetota bacterium]